MSEADYSIGLEQVRSILKGDISRVTTNFQNKIRRYVQEREFEKAAVLQDSLKLLKSYRATSTVINLKVGNLDVFSIMVKESKDYINFLQVRNDAIIDSKSLELISGIGEDERETLISAIFELRKDINSEARELVVPFAIAYPEVKVKITLPQKGLKKNY